MKSIKIIIASLLISCSALGQYQGKQVPINEIVSFSFPSGGVELTLKQLKSFKKSGKKSELNFDKNTGSFFKVNDFLLIIYGHVGKLPPDFLEDYKRTTEYLYSQTSAKNYSSEYKAFNNYKVLLVTYDLTDLSYVRFRAINNNRDSVLIGVVEYVKTDKDKVGKFVDDFLKGLKFKK